MPQINTEYFKAGMNRSTPGESFANDPDSPWAWEKQTKFSTIKECSEYVFEKVTEEDNYMLFMESIAQGTPLLEVSKMLVFSGFEDGLWNPDLMMLLVEPITYILMALCERADIPFTIDGEAGEEEELDNNSTDYEVLQRLQQAQASNNIPLPEGIEEKIDAMSPPPEGESPPIEPMPEEPPQSLLSMEQQ